MGDRQWPDPQGWAESADVRALVERVLSLLSEGEEAIYDERVAGTDEADDLRYEFSRGREALFTILGQRQHLLVTLQQIADGAESNPPHEIAALAREALAGVGA